MQERWGANGPVICTIDFSAEADCKLHLLVGRMWTTRTPSFRADAAAGGQAGIVVLSDVRFMRDALVAILERSDKFDVLGAAAELGADFNHVASRLPDVILIDANLPDAFATVHRIKQVTPHVRIVALALAEREDEVIAWVESGVSGYIPRSAALEDLVALLEGTMRGEQVCSPRVASGLVRRIAAGSLRERPIEPMALTRREVEIVHLINEGLSNKEIAQRLKIGLATAKSHVHNVLGKLGLERRSQAAQWMRRHGSAASLR